MAEITAGDGVHDEATNHKKNVYTTCQIDTSPGSIGRSTEVHPCGLMLHMAEQDHRRRQEAQDLEVG